MKGVFMHVLYADIILPVAVRSRFTYAVPEKLVPVAAAGVRATVRFGHSKLYTGIIARIHDKRPELEKIKEIEEICDPVSVVNSTQLSFWSWIADYYMCAEGEVMNAAVPAALFPEGSTVIPPVERYKKREETFIELAGPFSDSDLNSILGRLVKAPAQAHVLNTWLSITGYEEGREIVAVPKSLLLKESDSAPGIISALEKKGVFRQLSLSVGRLKSFEGNTEALRKLSPHQETAFISVKKLFEIKDTVLLHGVTSSGKTEIYIHLIEEQLKKGKQVLYMLPEIALTTQIILRLQRHFGSLAGVYHSKFNDQEKVEIWKKVADRDLSKGYRLILGVRSSIFLPFTDLGLVIVDEEHDGSYKQHDPSPRYHARDSAIVLASLHGAKTLLGSASPSVESYSNTVTGKYGLVKLSQRYGLINLPRIILANTREAFRKKLMVSHFTPELLNAIDNALGRNEQVMLFRNRRGFSPYIQCSDCGWIQACVNCAVNLTYHRDPVRMLCHHCGYTSPVPSRCGNCGSTGLTTHGFGTEKIEDEIKIVFPGARVGRMDQDTTRGKNGYIRLIKAFEDHQLDILIGTQMISKGLDFENLTVVGILNADSLLNFPDFRAHERSFQLMEQVSGRAGRRKKQGRVIIQTADPSNKIIRLVLNHDYDGLYKMQAADRLAFGYPPFVRMIKISLKHKDRSMLNTFSAKLGDDLRTYFGTMMLGPEYPLISQIQSFYIKNIIIKIGKDKSLSKAKKKIRDTIADIEKEKGSGGLRIVVDVDPY
ncbi:MAG TPA: primosomal protein N' [Bacteroidales bacterium]|nr:primosomal protein N' [Bacteroidales bacterium]